MTALLNKVSELIDLEILREQAKAVARKRAVFICQTMSADQWDAAADVEIELIAPNVKDAFAKQIKSAIEITRWFKTRRH